MKLDKKELRKYLTKSQYDYYFWLKKNEKYMFSEQCKQYSIYSSGSGNSISIDCYIGNRRKQICSFILDGKEVINNYYHLKIKGNIYIKIEYLEIIKSSDIIYKPNFEIFVNKDNSAPPLK